MLYEKLGKKLKYVKNWECILLLIMMLCLAGCSASESLVTVENADSESMEVLNSEGFDTEEKTSSETNQIEFEELTVVDNEECLIKINEIEPDNIWGYTLKVELENKSSEKAYIFSAISAAINGVQCDPLFANEVAAGKKANEEISFLDSTFKENGITDFTDIEISFRVYDSDNWNSDNVAEETVHVYPYGEDKAQTFVREAQDSDNVIVDNEYIKVVVTGYESDSIWGYAVNLFLLNKTDKEIMFSAENASVNGYMADPLWAASVIGGKCAFSTMSWSDAALEENGITSVEEIEFTLKAYDADDWMSDGFANELIKLEP